MSARKYTRRNTKKSSTKKKKLFAKWSKGALLKRFKQGGQKFLQTIGGLTILLLICILLITVVYNRLNQEDRTFEPDSSITHAQKQEFIHTIAPVAQKLQRQYGVLASVSMAQAMLESHYGQSQLAANYYNLFGVKTEATDPDGVDLQTQEFVNEEWVTITDRFKVYKDWEESMTKHAELIYYGTSWNPDFYQAVREGTTYKEQARGLQSAGYATDPDYADKLIAMIEEWNLIQYDQPLQEGGN